MNTAAAIIKAVIWLCFGVLLSACGGEPPALGEERPAPDEQALAAAMIEDIKAVSLQRHPAGVVKRFNQSKSLACLQADFQVPDDLSPHLRQGLFAQPGHYRALIRFANASAADDRDKDFRGMSIRIFGVGGEILWGENGVQDFLLNSYPALFAGTPAEFLDFIQAVRDDALWKFFVKPGNWDSLWIILNGRARISSPLDIDYWSTTPYRFGAAPSAVKYAARPCAQSALEVPADGPDYLARAIGAQLRKARGCFDFMVQRQADAQAMPIEDASVIWDESVSPFEVVARMTIPNQVFLTEQARDACERQAFNPWQSLAAHQPLGGINRVRRPVYAEIAAFRAALNQTRSTDNE